MKVIIDRYEKLAATLEDTQIKCKAGKCWKEVYGEIIREDGMVTSVKGGEVGEILSTQEKTIKSRDLTIQQLQKELMESKLAVKELQSRLDEIKQEKQPEESDEDEDEEATPAMPVAPLDPWLEYDKVFTIREHRPYEPLDVSIMNAVVHLTRVNEHAESPKDDLVRQILVHMEGGPRMLVRKVPDFLKRFLRELPRRGGAIRGLELKFTVEKKVGR